ncbi:hypothetical protein TNCV_527481 [Trichonephila clavipes]|nr:hypothetical protein TNCV_527481 [Trichonephila clavipes]
MRQYQYREVLQTHLNPKLRDLFPHSKNSTPRHKSANRMSVLIVITALMERLSKLVVQHFCQFQTLENTLQTNDAPQVCWIPYNL